MKLVAHQYRWLRWIAENGGACHMEGRVLIAGDQRSTTLAPYQVLRLVQMGLVSGSRGELRLTKLGLKEIESRLRSVAKS